MSYLFIINIALIGYIFWQNYKHAQTIREILASKISQETFEKIIAPKEKEEETPLLNLSEPLLDEVDAEELYGKLQEYLKQGPEQ